ncbi:hypothetical protein DFS34DRAFT_620813 [Phlyctochytrium arcticum]|nr:hypothetical protein DFS34DRAFT_620813 [Phlyctochytrium arcticum]
MRPRKGAPTQVGLEGTLFASRSGSTSNKKTAHYNGECTDQTHNTQRCSISSQSISPSSVISTKSLPEDILLLFFSHIFDAPGRLADLYLTCRGVCRAWKRCVEYVVQRPLLGVRKGVERVDAAKVFDAGLWDGQGVGWVDFPIHRRVGGQPTVAASEPDVAAGNNLHATTAEPDDWMMRLMVHPTLHGGPLVTLHCKTPANQHTMIIDGSSGLESLQHALRQVGQIQWRDERLRHGGAIPPVAPAGQGNPHAPPDCTSTLRSFAESHRTTDISPEAVTQAGEGDSFFFAGADIISQFHGIRAREIAEVVPCFGRWVDGQGWVQDGHCVRGLTCLKDGMRRRAAAANEDWGVDSDVSSCSSDSEDDESDAHSERGRRMRSRRTLNRPLYRDWWDCGHTTWTHCSDDWGRQGRASDPLIRENAAEGVNGTPQPMVPAEPILDGHDSDSDTDMGDEEPPQLVADNDDDLPVPAPPQPAAGIPPPPVADWLSEYKAGQLNASNPYAYAGLIIGSQAGLSALDKFLVSPPTNQGTVPSYLYAVVSHRQDAKLPSLNLTRHRTRRADASHLSTFSAAQDLTTDDSIHYTPSGLIERSTQTGAAFLTYSSSPGQSPMMIQRDGSSASSSYGKPQQQSRPATIFKNEEMENPYVKFKATFYFIWPDYTTCSHSSSTLPETQNQAQDLLLARRVSALSDDIAQTVVITSPPEDDEDDEGMNSLDGGAGSSTMRKKSVSAAASGVSTAQSTRTTGTLTEEDPLPLTDDSSPDYFTPHLHPSRSAARFTPQFGAPTTDRQTCRVLHTLSQVLDARRPLRQGRPEEGDMDPLYIVMSQADFESLKTLLLLGADETETAAVQGGSLDGNVHHNGTLNKDAATPSASTPTQQSYLYALHPRWRRYGLIVLNDSATKPGTPPPTVPGQPKPVNGLLHLTSFALDLCKPAVAQKRAGGIIFAQGAQSDPLMYDANARDGARASCVGL